MESEFLRLTIAEQHELLRLARETIAAALQSRSQPQLPTLTAALVAPSGVFVSLHLLGDLRGCVGTLAADRPLHENVSHMALVAAFEDPRFPPLTEPELPRTEIEISRLTVPVATTPDEVIPGRDGVCVVLEEHRGVFLPQVATTHGWDRERLLEEVCHKAGLSADTWRRRGCQLLRFQAEVFGEVSLKLKVES